MKRIRIGVLNDMSATPVDHPLGSWLEREVAAVQAAGRLDAEVEFIPAFAQGLPAGSAEAVRAAYDDLVRQNVVLITGPAIGDNALAATPWVEAAGVPTINWAGAERARGNWMFHLQVGSHEDESLVLARHFRDLGCQRIGVVFDRSPIGIRHLEYLHDEARVLGLEIVAAEEIDPQAEDSRAEVARVLGAKPDALCYLGLGLSAPSVSLPLAASGWEGPRAMNTAGIRGAHGDFARMIDGWTYIDMWSEANRTLAPLLAAHPDQRPMSIAVGHDMGRLVAEGLARAPELTREGVRRGLEQVKWLPAAEGHEGTLLGFGVQDRGALHGRYLVLRQWRDGKSVEVG